MRATPLLFVVAIMVATCRHSGTEPRDHFATVLGTYNLMLVDGRGLPVVISSDANGRVEILAGSVTLRADRSFTRTTTIRHLPVNAPSRTEAFGDQGTVELVGFRITLHVMQGGQPAAPITGALVGETIMYTVDDLEYRYEK